MRLGARKLVRIRCLDELRGPNKLQYILNISIDINEDLDVRRGVQGDRIEEREGRRLGLGRGELVAGAADEQDGLEDAISGDADFEALVVLEELHKGLEEIAHEALLLFTGRRPRRELHERRGERRDALELVELRDPLR